MRKIFRIQVQRFDGIWQTAPGDYRSAWEAEKAARVRCAWWRIVTGSGEIWKQGPTR